MSHFIRVNTINGEELSINVDAIFVMREVKLKDNSKQDYGTEISFHVGDEQCVITVVEYFDHLHHYANCNYVTTGLCMDNDLPIHIGTDWPVRVEVETK